MTIAKGDVFHVKNRLFNSTKHSFYLWIQFFVTRFCFSSFFCCASIILNSIFLTIDRTVQWFLVHVFWLLTNWRKRKEKKNGRMTSAHFSLPGSHKVYIIFTDDRWWIVTEFWSSRRAALDWVYSSQMSCCSFYIYTCGETVVLCAYTHISLKDHTMCRRWSHHKKVYLSKPRSYRTERPIEGLALSSYQTFDFLSLHIYILEFHPVTTFDYRSIIFLYMVPFCTGIATLALRNNNNTPDRTSINCNCAHFTSDGYTTSICSAVVVVVDDEENASNTFFIISYVPLCVCIDVKLATILLLYVSSIHSGYKLRNGGRTMSALLFNFCIERRHATQKPE